jgi:replication factor C large subunit
VGNKDAKQQFLNWLQSWNTGIPKLRAALLHGSPGIGKTVTIETAAKELNMELVETNASDYRTAEDIKRFAGLASQYSTLFGKKRLVLLDEVDGIAGKEDRGGMKELTTVLKDTRTPVVLTANDAYSSRFATMRKYCMVIVFKNPTVREVVSHLKLICAKEGIDADEEALKFIAERSGRDVRSAVNDLQALAQGKTRLVLGDVQWLAGRDRKEEIFKVLQTIIYSKDGFEAKKAVSSSDVDPDMLFNWIYENVPYHFTDPHDLVKALDFLSLADIYRKRIMDIQYWALLRYVIDFMSAGVTASRQHSKPAGWVPFRFPGKIQMLSRSKADRAFQTTIGLKISKRCHMSATSSINEIIPYIRIIFENNPEMAAGLVEWFDFDDEMVDYLAGGKKQTKLIAAKLG